MGCPLESFIGPGMPPIRAQKESRLAADLGLFAACFALTGGLRFIPCFLALARPLAFSPPLGFLPSLRVHAAVFLVAIIGAPIYSKMLVVDV